MIEFEQNKLMEKGFLIIFILTAFWFFGMFNNNSFIKNLGIGTLMTASAIVSILYGSMK